MGTLRIAALELSRGVTLSSAGQPQPERIARFFDGLEPVEPGTAPVSFWRPDPAPSGAPQEVDDFGGVARKPWTLSCFHPHSVRCSGSGDVSYLASVLAMSDDLPDVRASHGDRDRVVDALRVAAGDGRLNAEELDTRLERALAARTLGELAGLTADLVLAADDVLVVAQVGGKYVKEGQWRVPARIELRTQLCRVTLDFTHAMITASVLRINAEMVHGKLIIVSSPGIVIDAGGLNRTYSKVKLRSKDAAADPLLRIELVGTLIHAKVIQRRSRR